MKSPRPSQHPAANRAAAPQACEREDHQQQQQQGILTLQKTEQRGNKRERGREPYTPIPGQEDFLRQAARAGGEKCQAQKRPQQIGVAQRQPRYREIEHRFKGRVDVERAHSSGVAGLILALEFGIVELVSVTLSQHARGAIKIREIGALQRTPRERVPAKARPAGRRRHEKSESWF